MWYILIVKIPYFDFGALGNHLQNVNVEKGQQKFHSEKENITMKTQVPSTQ